MPELYDNAGELPDDLLESCRPMPMPTALLMCPPDYFDVSEVRNPYMEDSIGSVDFDNATRQWEALREAFTSAGATVEVIEPTSDCEDMVFCCDTGLVGFDAYDEPLCLLSQMMHAARQRELPAFARWYESHGYRVEHPPGDEILEGGGDVVWHPGRALLWCGYGFRTEFDAYDAVSDFFDVPALRIGLQSDRFYHLGACFCPLDEATALVFPPAMSGEGLEMVHAVFENVIECRGREAHDGMACNATAVGGTHVVIDQANRGTIDQLRQAGYTVIAVDTSEFRKSGGSVSCMKQYLV